MLGALASQLRAPANHAAATLGLSPWVLAPGGALGLLPLFVLIVLAFAVLAGLWRRRHVPEVRRAGFVPLALVVHLAYYAHFGSVTFRYTYPSFLLALLLFTLAFGRETRGTVSRPWSAALLTVLLAAVGAHSSLGAWRLGVGAMDRYHGLHDDLQALAGTIAATTEPGAVVGSFNSGILAELSGHPVVNLDGVMNRSVIDALRERRLAAYLDANGVRYLADFEGEITKFMDNFGGDPDWRTRWVPMHRRQATYLGDRTSPLVLLRRVR